MSAEPRENSSFLSVLTPKTWFLGWPRWWKTRSRFQKFFPLSIVLLYWLVLISIGGLTQDHLLIGSVVLALAYISDRSWRILEFLTPALLTVTIYDSMRHYADYLRGTVRVAEPYWFDKTFFGIQTSAGTLTPNEWLQLHTHWSLDLITGFFYLAFVGIFIGIAAYFRFWLGRKGTSILDPASVREKSRQMMWSFFWLNMLGYSTYYWYPAAPPWYVAKYGTGPADLTAVASAAGCLRFDELLGTNFFTGMYGRSADVFGAIPSLHVSYPLLAAIFAFQIGSLRKFSVFFYLIMCFSAVYLNHHYVLDLLWGSAYTFLIAWLVTRFVVRKPAVPSLP